MTKFLNYGQVATNPPPGPEEDVNRIPIVERADTTSTAILESSVPVANLTDDPAEWPTNISDAQRTDLVRRGPLKISLTK